MGTQMSQLLCHKYSDEGKKSNSSSDGIQLPLGGTAMVSTDSLLPLSARQKYSIIASWKGIRRAMEPTGVYMFLRLFEQHQDLLDLFDKFQMLKLKTPHSEEHSLELAEHATIVMSSLDESFKSLDNMDNFMLLLQHIGQTHRKIPGFKPEYFWRIVDPFLEAVKTTLGDRYTENIESIYKTTIVFTIKILVESYEKSPASLSSANDEPQRAADERL